MGRIFRLPRIAHAVTLDRLGKNHRWLALMVNGCVIGRVNFIGVMASAIQPIDIVVREVLNQLEQIRVLGKEVIADIATALSFEILKLAVHGKIHLLLEQSLVVLGEQRVPVSPPNDLNHIPARAPEIAFQLLDDLAVASNRTVETLKIAVHHEYEVVQALPAG